jgi:hypothetical protein
MDSKIPDDGERSPLQMVKAQHDLLRRAILHNDIDEMDWDATILPEQVGLAPVWASSNGQLWTIVHKGGRLKLVRMDHIT